MGKYDDLELRDAAVAPNEVSIGLALQDAFGAYERFVGLIAEAGIDHRWQFYPDGNSWLAKGSVTKIGPRGGRKEIPLYWLSIWRGYFKVVVYFKVTERGQAAEAPVSPSIRTRIEAAKQMGKLNQFPVEFDMHDAGELPDALALIKHKRDLYTA